VSGSCYRSADLRSSSHFSFAAAGGLPDFLLELDGDFLSRYTQQAPARIRFTAFTFVFGFGRLSCFCWPPSQIQISPPEVLRSAHLFCPSRCLPRGEIVQLVSICVLAGHFAPLAELAPVFSTAVRFSVPAPRGSQPHFRSRQSFPVQPS
jgi:hypothetical protein